LPAAFVVFTVISVAIVLGLFVVTIGTQLAAIPTFVIATNAVPSIHRRLSRNGSYAHEHEGREGEEEEEEDSHIEALREEE
jgi:hypothetical protein